MLNLAWAKTFLALVETKSFQAAADQLHLAQPTVSQQIRKLEEELGVVLVRRSRSGCEPTPAAFAFMPYATSLIRISERALTAVRTGQTRVGASSKCRNLYPAALCAADFCATMTPNSSTS